MHLVCPFSVRNFDRLDRPLDRSTATSDSPGVSQQSLSLFASRSNQPYVWLPLQPPITCLGPTASSSHRIVVARRFRYDVVLVQLVSMLSWYRQLELRPSKNLVETAALSRASRIGCGGLPTRLFRRGIPKPRLILGLRTLPGRQDKASAVFWARLSRSMKAAKKLFCSLNERTLLNLDSINTPGKAEGY